MNRLIKAIFNNEQQAEYTESCINAYFPAARTDLTVINGTGGYYSTIVPSVMQNNGISGQFYCPVFYSNNDNENAQRRAVLEIKCSPEYTGEIERIILDNGGDIRA